MPTVTIAPILARLILKIFNLSIKCTKVGYIVDGYPRAGIRGGNANNNSNDGLGYVNVGNAVGYANADIGARLSAFLYNSLRSRNDTVYSHHRTVGGIMDRIGVSKLSYDKAESSRLKMQTGLAI